MSVCRHFSRAGTLLPAVAILALATFGLPTPALAQPGAKPAQSGAKPAQSGANPAQPGAPAGRRPVPVDELAAPAAPAAAGLDTPQATLGYALGLQIGSRIAADFRRQPDTVDLDAMTLGLADALAGAQPRIPQERLIAALERFQQRMEQEQQAFIKQMAEKAKINQAKAVKFLGENARKKGVVTLPSGLQYEVLKAGSGPKPKPTDTISAHYLGTHLDGSEFDKSTPESGPMSIPIEQVVPGWQEALPLMETGSKWRLWIPPDLAYGERGSPPAIEPNELLVFEIELLGIEAPK